MVAIFLIKLLNHSKHKYLMNYKCIKTFQYMTVQINQLSTFSLMYTTFQCECWYVTQHGTKEHCKNSKAQHYRMSPKADIK